MPLDDYFPATIAIDPTTSILVKGAESQVFAWADTSFSTPLAITDLLGVPIAYLESSPSALYSEFKVPGHVQVRVRDTHSGVVTPMTSFYGAVIAAGLDPDTVAEAIAAGANAAAVLTAALQAKTDAEAAAARAEAVPTTSDGIMTAVMDTPGALFPARLNSAYAMVPEMPNAASGYNVFYPEAFGSVTGDATVAVRAALAAAIAAGGVLRFMDGKEYVTDELRVTGPCTIVVPATSAIKLKGGGTETGGMLTAIRISSSNVTVLCDGWIDANRSAQDRIAFNAAGGSSGGKYYFGVRAQGSSLAPLTNVVVNARVRNAVDMGFSGYYLGRGCQIEVTVATSGAGVSISDSSRFELRSVELVSLDNTGWRVFPHSFDLTRVSQAEIGVVRGTDLYGTGTVAGGTSLSDIISGMTWIAVSDTSMTMLSLETRVAADMRPSLGVSILGSTRLEVASMKLLGFTEQGVELGGVTDSQFGPTLIDGRYQAAAGSPSGRGLGTYNNAYYRDISSRSQQYTERCQFTNWVIRRCLDSGHYLTGARVNTFIAMSVTACKIGLQSEFFATEQLVTFPGQAFTDLANNRFIGCDWSWNELWGVKAVDAKAASFVGCSANNNGQSSAYPTGSRKGGTIVGDAAGFSFRTSVSVGSVKSSIVLEAPEAGDSQSFGENISFDPSQPTQVVVGVPGRYHAGQTIRLYGVGAGGADLTTRINEMDMDTLTLADAMSTFPTVAGTGTISSSGTAVTGAGTAFVTQFPNRFFLNAGGIMRQVVRVIDATHMEIVSPFPADLPAGTTFTINRAPAGGIQSQKYGIDISSDTLSPVVLAPRLIGNTSSPLRDQSVSATPAVVNFGVAVQDIRSDVTVVNSAAETVLGSFQIPQGLLPGDGVSFDFGFDRLNNSGGNVVFLLRLKLGTTTLFASSATLVSSANRIGGRVRGRMLVVGPATEQRITASFEAGSGSSVNNANSGGNIGTRTVNAAEDLTAGRSLTLTIQMDTASSSADTVLRMATMDVLKRSL